MSHDYTYPYPPDEHWVRSIKELLEKTTQTQFKLMKDRDNYFGELAEEYIKQKLKNQSQETDSKKHSTDAYNIKSTDRE